MAIGNLFKKAKENATEKKVNQKEKKLRIRINIPGYFDKLKRQAIVLDEMKKLKAESELHADEIKEIGIEAWAKVFEESGVNPDSVMIEVKESEDPNSDTAQFMLIPQDKYIGIKEEDAARLKEQFGEDVVLEKDTYEVDPDMLDKYGDIISHFIETCDQIPPEHKIKIFKAVTTREVKKGTIDKIAIISKEKEVNINEVIRNVKPTFLAKNVEYIPATAVY